jgi:lactate dehydrogenase-like 2-hydroxyacid dehydrogenase
LQAVLLADGAAYKRVSASVKVIVTYSVGYDHIDLRAAAERKIAIAYTPSLKRMPLRI